MLCGGYFKDAAAAMLRVATGVTITSPFQKQNKKDGESLLGGGVTRRGQDAASQSAEHLGAQGYILSCNLVIVRAVTTPRHIDHLS